MLGICNGFQILVEAGLLPGALVRNAGLKFICREVRLRTETTQFAVHLATPQRARCCACPSRTAKAATIADERTLDRTGSRGPRRLPLSRQSQRLAARHRRHPEPGAQRDGDDAASRARHRAADGIERRPGDFPIHGCGPGGRKHERNHARADRAAPADRAGIRKDRLDSGPRADLYRARAFSA